MSIVPRNAAPVPQWAQQIYGTGAIGGGAGGGPPAQGYTGTDWSRTGQPSGKMVWQPGGTVEYTDPVTGETYTMDIDGKWAWQTDGGRTAVPPGFAQPSYGSQYGPQWRGAGFGPGGRMGATSNNRATTYYGPGFEPWVDNPDTDLDTPPTLPPWWPKGGDTGGGGIGPPVIPPPDPDKPPVTDPNTDNPPTGTGTGTGDSNKPWWNYPDPNVYPPRPPFEPGVEAPPIQWQDPNWRLPYVPPNPPAPKVPLSGKTGTVRGPDVKGGGPRPYSPGVGMPDTGVAYTGPIPWNPHPATPKPPSTKTMTVRGPDVKGGAPRPYTLGGGVPDNPLETTMKPAIRWPKKMSKGWV